MRCSRGLAVLTVGHQPPCLHSTGSPRLSMQTPAPRCTDFCSCAATLVVRASAHAPDWWMLHDPPSLWQCTWVCLGADPLHHVSRVPMCAASALRRLLLNPDSGPLPLLQREHAKTWIQERFAPIIASVKVGLLRLHRAVCLVA